MNEIEKMYENAGIDRIGNKKCTPAEFSDCQNYCFISENNKCDKFSFDYPPFTADKQLAIFKMFCKRYLSVSQHTEKNGDLCFGIVSTVGKSAVSFNKDFEECLAGYVNCLWQSLTKEEKQQVKGILE